VRHGIHIAPFGELSEPSVLGDLAQAAEEAGFDGVFVWDHIARPHKNLSAAHTAVALAVIAMRTSRVRFGALVTPLSRRRPHDVARESVTLDRLSGGRFVLGVGLGVNSGGELERFGEEVDERVRGDRLDEALDVVLALWSGDPVSHSAAHFMVDDVAFTPTPVQSPRIPVWVAARRPDRPRPLRRAASMDGVVPETDVDGLQSMLGQIKSMRGNLDGFDVVLKGPPGVDPSPFHNAGATWWLTELPEVVSAAVAFRLVQSGPPS
jgi:alkanesulfonate monooxygenase SsuD/methylene tetrahydromethanopterin reductase-like flavin-dependent oxidoreductase (luciferase family)